MVDVTLGEDLIKQLEITNTDVPIDAASKTLKFDAKGTPHLMYRDGEGKLLGNIPVKELHMENSYRDELRRDIAEYEEKRTGNRTNKMFNFICVGLVVLVIMSMYIVKML